MNKINKENIEAYLLDFVEGRLTKEEREELLAYLEEHTEYKSMLDLYDKNLVLKQDRQIVFADKNNLKHRPTLRYWKRMVYIASSVAAVLLIIFLLQPIKNNVTDSRTYNTPNIAKQNTSKPLEKNIITMDSSRRESRVGQDKFLSDSTKKTLINKAKTIYTQDTFKKEDLVASMGQDEVLDSSTIHNNTLTLIAQEPLPANDTIYIIYAGSKKENTLQRVSDYVEKHTNWNMMQTVSSIKEIVEDVKEKKEKYFSF